MSKRRIPRLQARSTNVETRPPVRGWTPWRARCSRPRCSPPLSRFSSGPEEERFRRTLPGVEWDESLVRAPPLPTAAPGGWSPNTGREVPCDHALVPLLLCTCSPMPQCPPAAAERAPQAPAKRCLVTGTSPSPRAPAASCPDRPRINHLTAKQKSLSLHQ